MTYSAEFANGGAEQFESFTEADMESVGLEVADLEGLESLESLESISVESVAEDLEGYMEGTMESATPSSYVNKRLLQVFTALVKTSIKKITTNPKTRVKLQAACRKGPDAVTQLLLPMLIKAMPSYFNWMPAVLVPPIVTQLLPAICKQAGLKTEEVAAAEFVRASALTRGKKARIGGSLITSKFKSYGITSGRVGAAATIISAIPGFWSMAQQK